ncbi:30S ribosomal protein S8 [Candidatus Peregrinibacteria bacterium]|jgi:small subunit ribosomal protein S8|nr:30S ribosomal protein S8 [Candidatus Peregrinibacteria bacterium]MBT6401826.1 30S ribosomal protein S8 [candidate division WWE3 bacterium]MBT7736197.1 30S ribosomal protein S8 [Candidatus Peregrinibacteria bacterium]
MYTDPIADLLTRIRNATSAHHEKVSVPHSKLKESILKVMKGKDFIDDYKATEEEGKKNIQIILKEDRQDLVLKRKSKPGQRIYIKKEDLKPVKNGLGILIISTSKGVMTNSDAYKQNLGGELICEMY